MNNYLWQISDKENYLFNWRFKGKKEVKKSPKYEMSYEDEVAGLVIHKTTPNDAGVYSCQATNIIGQVQTEGTLSVHSKYKYIFTMMVNSSPIWTKQTTTSHLKSMNTKQTMTYNNGNQDPGLG